MRLIDVDERIAKWKAAMLHMVKESDGRHAISMEVLIEDLKNAPTIDAVPVVRCKECKEYRTLQAMTYYKNGVHIRCCPCELMGRLMKDDDFCSYGERKDGEG